MSRPAANTAISGMPTPIVNLKIKVKNNQGENLALLCAHPDTGASVDCIEENFAKKHNLEIQPDTSNMIELINSEGKVMKVVGTTRIKIMVKGGTRITTVTL